MLRVKVIAVQIQLSWDLPERGDYTRTLLKYSLTIHWDNQVIFPSNFHHCGLEPGDDIVNYGNRAEVQTCELDSLADLATDTEYVRGGLAQYANDLLTLGVDGLRLDASKHSIPTTDIANILSRLTSKGHARVTNIRSYTDLPRTVFRFRYTTALKNAFLGGGISSLQNLDNQRWISGSQANVFVTNHHTERNGGSLSQFSPSNT
ncbi:hypothetical protein D9758_014631 [Tetrapyrgos nigripes]|uniref:Alpha-amylase n=1 Tax=Tetrapyrgos nigripes TaxID=182062 RepID=A0A8H5FUP7_9AGAR|nr:hypothetical protein D9758_014631 [Tetrapyrgos nigripes]